MGYLSFDASIKIHQSGHFSSTKTKRVGFGGISGYIRHVDRETDKRNNCEVSHSNPDINPDLTLNNESYFKDSQGIWQRTDTSKDMLNAVNQRIAFAREHGARITDKGKNDTVIARPIIIQLDNDTIVKHEDTWSWDIIEIIETMFEKENIVAVSLHKDETNVHAHILFVPCYSYQTKGGIKCTLSQTKFFKNPKQLASMHKQIRKELQAKGYRIEQENKPIMEHLAGYHDSQGIWHQQGLTPQQLKELTNRKNQLKEKEKALMLEKAELDALAEAMMNVQANAKATHEQLQNSMRIFECQQADFENEKANLQTQMKAVIDEKKEVEKMRKNADDMLQKAFSVSDICQKILHNESTLNKQFLDFLDHEGKRRNKQIRQSVENLYKRFDEERRSKMTELDCELDAIRAQGRHQRLMDSLENNLPYNKPTTREIPEFNLF